MWNKIFIVLLSYLIVLNTVQSELDLTFYDTEAVIVDQEYYRDFETFVNDGNAGIFINFTIIKKFPDSTRSSYKLLGASMGEFVVPTGMNIDVDFCTIFEPNYRLIGDQVELLGINADNCPPELGTYGTDNLALDTDNLPDVFPPNNYMAIFKVYNQDFMYKTKIFLEFKIYARLAI